MLSIPSLTFGNIDVDEQTVYRFEAGIPGFKKLRQFAILDVEEDTPFNWLQACEAPYMTLLMIDPMKIVPDYVVRLAPPDHEKLQVESMDDIVAMALVTVPKDPRLMTANLAAPLVFNFKSRLGLQIIQEGESSLLKVRVFKD